MFTFVISSPDKFLFLTVAVAYRLSSSSDVNESSINAARTFCTIHCALQATLSAPTTYLRDFYPRDAIAQRRALAVVVVCLSVICPSVRLSQVRLSDLLKRLNISRKQRHTIAQGL